LRSRLWAAASMTSPWIQPQHARYVYMLSNVRPRPTDQRADDWRWLSD
jgi:hypothetical protein